MNRATSCPDQERLADYVRGALEATAKADIESHLHTCVACTKLYTRLEASLKDESEESHPSSMAVTIASPGAEAVPEENTVFGAGTPGIAPSKIPFLDPPQKTDELGRLAHFRILKQLGAGGMGIVFLAEDTALERPVALKVMLPDIAKVEDSAARFVREAKLTASIKSDHIVTIYHVGGSVGVPFFAMELLQGLPLDEWMRKTPNPSVKDILRIGRELAVGLMAAHVGGLVHRDIKPANIWMEAPRGRVKILDFGLARPVQGGEHLTHSGAIIGTPAYMAPEQARGKIVDSRSDLFSLGCVLYQMATGNRPFSGADSMEVLSSLALDTPPDPNEVNPTLPPELAALIMRLLAKKPDDRPPTARKVAEELTRIRKELDQGSNTALPSLRSMPAPKVEPLVPLKAEPLAVPKVEPVVPNKPWWSPPSNPWAGIDDDPTEQTVPQRAAPKPLRASPIPLAAPPAPLKKKRNPSLWIALGIFGLIAAVVFFVTVISVKTEKGTLMIEADDPNLEITLRKDGATIFDRSTKREIELSVGDYEIDLVEKKDGLKLSTKSFTITKNGKQTVKVTFEKAVTSVPK